MRRRDWLLDGLRTIAWFVLMVPVGLVTMVLAAPAMIAFALGVVVRLPVGFVAGLAYPPLGQRIMPNDDSGDWLDPVIDVAFKPMDWLSELLP